MTIFNNRFFFSFVLEKYKEHNKTLNLENKNNILYVFKNRHQVKKYEQNKSLDSLNLGFF